MNIFIYSLQSDLKEERLMCHNGQKESMKDRSRTEFVPPLPPSSSLSLSRGFTAM